MRNRTIVFPYLVLAGLALTLGLTTNARAQNSFTGGSSGTGTDWFGWGNWYIGANLGLAPGFPDSTANTFITGKYVELTQTSTTIAGNPWPAVTGPNFAITNSSLWIHENGGLSSQHVDIASTAGQSANVTVSGSTAWWSTSGDMGVGSALNSTGTLTVSAGASLAVGNNGIFVGYGDGSTGTLNIGDYNLTTAPGSVSTTGANGKIFFGNGTGILNFNHTHFVYNFSAPLHSLSPGKGQIVQRGIGVTTLTGDNSGFTGQVTVESGDLEINGSIGASLFTVQSGELTIRSTPIGPQFFNINGGNVTLISNTQRDFGSAIYTGGGELWVGGGGTVVWGGTAIFQLGSGSKIDVRYGTMIGGNGGNENWVSNKSDLNVGGGNSFLGYEADVRVDALSGSGTLASGYKSGATVYGSVTFGVDNGSGTFNGVLADSNTAVGHIGRFIKEGSGTQILTGNNTFTGGLTVDGGYVQVNADAGLGAASSPLTINGGGIRFGANVNNLRGFTVGNNWGWIDTNGFNVTSTQNISGTGVLTKYGGGTLTLTGTNTQGGGLIIQGGTVSVGSDASLGASGATVTIESGTLALTASVGINRQMAVGNAGLSSGDVSVSAGQTAVWNGNVSGSGNAAFWKNDPGNLWVLGDIVLGSVQINGGSLVATGMLNLSKNAVISSGAKLVLNFDSGGGGGHRYYTGNTSFSGAGTLVKTGDGDVHWGSSSATFALAPGSLIDVQAGAFSGGNDGNETWTNNKSDLRVDSGATFNGNEAYIRVDALSNGINGGGMIRSGWAGAGSITVGVDDGSGTFSGTLVDTDKAGGHIGSLVKEGTGTQTLTGNNTYTGPTTVINGALVLTGDTKSPTFTLGLGAATLEFNLASDRDYGSVTFDGFGILKKTGTGRLYWGTSAATFALNSGSRIDVQGGTFTGGSNDNEAWTNNKSDLNVAAGARFDGVEAHVRVDALTGGGTITSGYSPTGPGSFTFGVDNGSGTFSGVLANGSNPGRFFKAGTGMQILSGANTYTGGTTVAAGTLQIGNGGVSGSISGNVSNSGALVFNRSDNSSYAGVISGTGTVAKQGSGILTLTGANTYTGGTTIAAGTLQLGNSGANLPDLGAVHVSGGTLALGASVEIIGSLVLDSQGAISFDLSGAGSYEHLTITNGATLTGGTLRLALSNGYVPSIGATFDLLDWGGTLTGSFTTLELPAGITWNTSNLYTNGTLSVVAIPEPAAIGLLIFGGGFLAGARRRKSFSVS